MRPSKVTNAFFSISDFINWLIFLLMAACIVLGPITASVLNGLDGVTYSQAYIFLVIPSACALLSATSYLIAKRSRLAVLAHVVLYIFLAIKNRAILPVYLGYVAVLLIPHILLFSEIKRT